MSCNNVEIYYQLSQKFLHTRNMYPHGQRVEPDVSIPIHGLSPDSSKHFQNPVNLSDGVNKRVHGSHGSSTVYRTVYSYANW